MRDEQPWQTSHYDCEALYLQSLAYHRGEMGQRQHSNVLACLVWPCIGLKLVSHAVR